MSSTAGSITVTAVAMRDWSMHPKEVFDINLSVNDGDEPSSLGLLRYFVLGDIESWVDMLSLATSFSMGTR